MHSYIPATSEDKRALLSSIGIEREEDAFGDLERAGALLEGPLDLPKGRSELEVSAIVRSASNLNKPGICFIGGGAQDHAVSSVTSAITSLPSFVTAYTPYQPEISQGVLQAIFEYQSIICTLTGMDVSNASLYDGPSSVVEAASLAISAKRKSSKIVVSPTILPQSMMCLNAWALGTGNTIQVLGEKDGRCDFSGLEGALDDSAAMLIVQSPNRYGLLESFDGLADRVHEKGSLLAIYSDALSLASLRSPAEWGADLAIGDTQSLGLGLGFGGPYCGYMASRQALMRKMPGRIIGQTEDSQGRRCFVLTLQAREQHIKRERATSNICSNEALCCLATAVQSAMLGPEGMKEAFSLSYHKAHWLYERLMALGLKSMDEGFWDEFPLVFESHKKARAFQKALGMKGILVGFPAEKESSMLMVAVTEKRTREDMEAFLQAAKEAL
ncbi:MAG: aminomethyl-transferring glycine dehydrogenase subunit GcvPA [Sphaerochaetaceae bacterium]|nr:aminomethyl-transferring glycine dehydrogenase subunit GcvPA [Sphaerochaetaceae bacterium]